MSAKTRAILLFPDIEDSISYINKIVQSIKSVQKSMFDEYIDRNNIKFIDHRSYDDIRKVKVEYLSGIEIDTSFFITINVPRYESNTDTISIWNHEDSVPTSLFCMRMAVSSTISMSNELPVSTDGSKLLWLESTYNDMSSVFISSVMDKFRQTYYINPNTLTSTYRKSILY